jgi:hypothetical protein
LRSDEEEVRDVRARDQQDDCDRTEENPERPADAAENDIAQRRHEHAELRLAHERRPVRPWKLLWQASGQSRRFGLSRGEGHPRGEPRDGVEIV